MNAKLKTVQFLVVLLITAWVPAWADVDRFVGEFVGHADVDESGTETSRDMSVNIEKTKSGFSVNWKSTSYRADGRVKEKEYTIQFLTSQRDGIYSSAMGVNVFGKAIPLDPMTGDPFVWGRISGDTLTVYSMLIDEVGGYEMQEYHRTLTETGLHLDYRRVRNGQPLKNIEATLVRR